MKRLCIILICLLIAAGNALADGKIYCTDKAKVDVPYQRAVILHKKGIETLVVQSRFVASAPSDMGWVVPVPAEPEVAQLPDGSNFMFNLLDVVTKPKITKRSEVIAIIAFSLLAAMAIVGILAASLSYMLPIPLWRMRGRRRAILKSSLLVLLILLVMAAIIFPTFSDKAGVEGVSWKQAGVYDVMIMKPNDMEALLSWLDEHNLKVEEEDRTVFADYLSRGWYFVVAKVKPDYKADCEGLSAPLILRFASETPVYPLALGSRAKGSQETLIYVLSEQKMMTDDRLLLRFAGEWPGYPLTDKATQPPGYLSGSLSKMYLSKFKGILTPAKMDKDIIFTPVPDSPYREHMIEW